MAKLDFPRRPPALTRWNPWWLAMAAGLTLAAADACGGTATGGGGDDPSRGGGGSGGRDDVGGGAHSGGAGGLVLGGSELCTTEDDRPSPCPTPSAECCEALTEHECHVYGDACRFISFPAHQTCDDFELKRECFFVDVDEYFEEDPPQSPCDTSPQIGTGVGANTAMYRILDDGTPEVGMFTYGTCGIHGWFACSEPDAPSLCICQGGVHQGCTTP